ncbi:MAG: transposase [Eubacterium sp.]
MANYSCGFKKNVVLAYINSEDEIKYIAEKHGIKNKSEVGQWVKNHQTFGDE